MVFSRPPDFASPKRRLTGILALLLLIGLSLSSPSAASQKEIVAAVPKDFPPHLFWDAKTNQPEGFGIDVLNALAGRLGLTVRYKVYETWTDIDNAARQGLFDIIPDVGIIGERTPFLRYTDPIETFFIYLFVRDEATEYNSLTDLKGKSIGAVRANQALFLLQDKEDIELAVFENFETLLIALLSGEVDAIAAPEPPLLFIAERSALESRIKKIGRPLAEVKRAIAVVTPGRAELYSLLADEATVFVHSPEYLAIYQKWYGKQNASNLKEWLIGLASLVAGVAILLLIRRHLTVLRLNEKLLHSQEELRESDKRFRQLAENVPEVFWIGSIDWREIYYISPAYEKIFGKSCASLYEKPMSWLKCVAPEDRNKVLATIPKDSAEIHGEIIFPVYKINRSDGSQRYIRARAFPVRDEQQRIYRIAGIAEDITRQKRSEAAVAQSELLFRQLFEKMSSGVAIYQPVDDGWDFLIDDMNDAGLKIVALDRDDLLGKSIMAIFPGVERMGLLEILRRVCRTGVAEQQRVTHYEDDRLQLWVENSVFKVPSGQLIAVFDDITRRKAAEEKLLESNSLLRAIIDGTTDVIFMKDLQGRYTLINNAVSQAFGKKQEDIIGRTDAELFPSPSAKLLRNNDDAVIAEGKPILFEEKLTIPPDEETYWLTNKTPFFDKTGRIIGLLGIAHNVTRLKKEEREKAALEKRLHQLQNMETIGTLAGGIAHDFNNILTSIIGFAELAMLDSPADSTAADDLQNVLNAGLRAKNLVRQILAFSSQVDTDHYPIQPLEVVREAVHFLRSSLPTNISLKEEYGQETGPVRIDPTKLHQIVMNLCTNACQAMEQNGGSLKVSLREEEIDAAKAQLETDSERAKFIHLEVRDTGPGIDPEIQDRIFEPYFTTKGIGKGTGLGLSIVHGIVKKAGGNITVATNPGGGTVFHVYLPVAEKMEAGEVFEESGMPLGSESILLVEDEELIAYMMKELLERLGYRVITRQNGAEALRTFQEDPGVFDLVITDLTIPEITGDVLARLMVEIRPDIPIILCSGDSAMHTEIRSKASGIRAFVRKPVSFKDLAGVIHSVLNKASVEQNTTPAKS